MDIIIIIGLIALIGLIAGFLLYQKKQKIHALKPVNTSDTAKKWQQGQLELDPQTRFVEMPKRKQYRLLNDSEQALYHRLREAMPSMQVFVQVGVAQLALLRGRHEAKRLIQMAGRGVDFVVCDHEFAIIAAIELAWPSTDEHGINSESEKHEALQSLGIPLIVFRPNDLPDAEAISREIAEAIIHRNRLESDRR
jgi:hypothetical protein